MTLSAWIMPTANQSGWRTIMQRETDSYFLNASNGAGPLRPAGGGTFGTSTAFVSGPTANPVNAWTHVALTYDGATQRLFVNGTQVATRATTGTIQATNNPLWIGGNNPYGEYFTGLIDDVRVYNRALTQTDIQADMNTGDPAHGAGDTTAPSAPTGLTATASAGQVEPDLDRRRPTTSGSPATASSAARGRPARPSRRWERRPGPRFTDTGLAAVDDLPLPGAGGRRRRQPQPLLLDRHRRPRPPPVTRRRRRRPRRSRPRAVSTTRIDLGWTASTDNVGVTGYRVERCQGAGCTTFAQVGTPTGDRPSATPGWRRTRRYRYRVRAVDAAGNLSAYSSIVTATTPAPPTRRAPSAPTGLTATAVSTTRIDLSWTASTDNVGVTGYRVERCQGAELHDLRAGRVRRPATAFSDTGLAADTTYRYRVRAVDGAGNLSAYSSIATATTPAAADTTRAVGAHGAHRPRLSARPGST